MPDLQSHIKTRKKSILSKVNESIRERFRLNDFNYLVKYMVIKKVFRSLIFFRMHNLSPFVYFKDFFPDVSLMRTVE